MVKSGGSSPELTRADPRRRLRFKKNIPQEELRLFYLTVAVNSVPSAEPTSKPVTASGGAAENTAALWGLGLALMQKIRARIEIIASCLYSLTQMIIYTASRRKYLICI